MHLVIGPRIVAVRCDEQVGALGRYHRFMVARADQYYRCELDLTAMDASRIWVPEGEDYGGLCDRLIVCGWRQGAVR